MNKYGIPKCDFRDDFLADGRVCGCTHPRRCAPAKVAAVKTSTCQSCEFVAWAPDDAVRLHQPRRPSDPSVHEYARRVNHCRTCGARCENYCLRAGGPRGLLIMLAKTSFTCPLGLFGRADDDGGTVAQQADTAAEPPTEPVDGVPVVETETERTPQPEGESGDVVASDEADEPPRDELPLRLGLD